MGDVLNFTPMSRRARAWSHLTWAVRHPARLVVVAFSAIPAVRRHVLDTTPLKDHPSYNRMTRALWAEWEAKGLLIMDHPAGCFYGSFAEAYPDAWHIPHSADCGLPHGPSPIQLGTPGEADDGI